MENIVYDNSQKSPTAIAVADGDSSLTCAELVAESIGFAQILNSKGDVTLKEAITILLGPGIKQIIFQLAVRLAGGTCVPIEPSILEHLVKGMLQDIYIPNMV